MATETATPVQPTPDDKPQAPKASSAPLTAAATPTKSSSEALQLQSAPTATLVRSSFPLPNGRPIEPSFLRISDKYSLPGNRPVFVSDLAVVDSSVFPGRPVFHSALKDHMTGLFMNRPIASNEMGDEDLMSYL